MKQLHTSDLLRVVQYQTDECLLEFPRHCGIPVHLQLSVMLIKLSVSNKTLSKRQSVVYRPLRDKEQNFVMVHILSYGEHCMHRACIHTKHSEYISDPAVCLRGWNFASGSMAIAGCIVTSCLLAKRNSIATVSITHTNLMCGQMGILTRLCRVT